MQLTDFELSAKKAESIAGEAGKRRSQCRPRYPRRSLHTSAMFGLAAYIALLSMPIGAAEAQGMKPIQNPITGNEDLGDLSQPQQALAQFYRGFNTRDRRPSAIPTERTSCLSTTFSWRSGYTLLRPMPACGRCHHRSGVDSPHGK
jgi:hypothetical protein